MIDIKLLRDDVLGVIKKLETRNADFSYLKDVVSMDEIRREKITSVEVLKRERNEKSKLIGQLKRENKDASEIMNTVSDIGDKIAKLDIEIAELDEKINYLLLTTPNILHESVPIGKDEKDNPVIKTYL